MVSDKQLKEDVFSFLRTQELDKVSRKTVRRHLETKHGLENKAMDDKKQVINDWIQEFVSQQQDDDDDDVDDDPPPPPATKKRKAPAEDAAGDDEKPKVKTQITTRTGVIAPTKGLKEEQKNAMSPQDFEEQAGLLELDVFGNKIVGAPRTFTSSNRGWYAGGKIQVPVGDQLLWAQLGINITIVGSKEWEE
eukprot:m.483170 g.483170  ORF g.483170 m.483170 type:complete len:192 (+) comp22803_c0_seq1:117-692(+)